MTRGLKGGNTITNGLQSRGSKARCHVFLELAIRHSVKGMEAPKEDKRIVKTVSRRLQDGGLVELIYQPTRSRTALAICRGGEISLQDGMDAETGERLVPIGASNNLIRHGALLLPGDPEEFDSAEDLVGEIKAYLRRYVDLSDGFERIAAYYVLLTWVYDAFNEVPYLRFRGDFGSGKTRALLTVGSLCYKAFFASGASTVSPIFHILDTFRGTLILDEADFRFSDEKSELVKILNNGNVKGFPVLRTAVTVKREFNPRAFDVFGPKIVAMRRSFEDQALESRFLTENLGQRSLRSDIPINLPDCQKTEAETLRSRLLVYRFRTLSKTQIDPNLADRALSPRLNQILLPLLSIVASEDLREEIRNAVRGLDKEIYAERSSSSEAGVLEILLELLSRPDRANVPVSELAIAFSARFGAEYERPITNRFIGGILRKRLHLLTYKSHGVYVVPISEKSKIEQLAIRYGVVDRAEMPSG